MLKNVKIKNIEIKNLKKFSLKRFFNIKKITGKETDKPPKFIQNFIYFVNNNWFFYILPPSYKYLSKTLKGNPEIENSSNQKLVLALEGKLLESELSDNYTDQDLVYQELYGEVTEEDSLESGVRLKASVLYQLFEDTNYKLSDVRSNKIAKPVEIGKLPYELKEIQSVKKKGIVHPNCLPLILEENNKILLDRKSFLQS